MPSQLPEIAASFREFIRRVNDGVRGQEAAQFAACASGGLVDLGARNAACNTGSGALCCRATERCGDGERDRDGVVAPGADLQYDGGADFNRTACEAIGGVTRVMANQ